jgi:hypothetical protein
MAKFDEDAQSDQIEDRRNEPQPSEASLYLHGLRNSGENAYKNLGYKIRNAGGDKGPSAPKGSLADEAGLNSFAGGGEVDDDNDAGSEPDNDADDQTQQQGAIPTGADNDDQNSPDAQEAQMGQADNTQGTSAVPGASQSGGGQVSELLALVRAINSYGLKTAQQGGGQQQAGAIPTQGGQQQQDPLMQHLGGAKAMDPNIVRAIEYALDPQGSMPPVEKKMRAVQHAYQKGLQQTGDPREAANAALGVLQHQRKNYDMWRTAAAVKMHHGDIGSAIEAANKAFEAPFGHTVHFAPAGDSVTATITGG